MSPEYREGVARYNTAAVVLHWLIVLLLVAQIWIGYTFSGMDDGSARSGLFAWHRTLGFTILLVSLLRLGWRLLNPPPPFPDSMPRWERVLARTNHIAFYVVLIALPLTGWIYVSTGSTAAETGITTLVNDIPWPILPGLPRDWHGPSADVHGWLVVMTLLLVLVHVGAALKHQFVDRAPVANRMPPFRVRRRD